MKKMLLSWMILFVMLSGVACTPGKSSEGGVFSQNQGRVVFAITDAAADMGTVTSVKVTVDSVKVHSDTKGWVTLSSAPKTYDLLELKAQGTQALLADVSLDDGTYQQLRLDISNVVVTDAQGQHEAKLPSGELKIVGDLVVKANSTSTALFDFSADESLHVTGNGEYILAPVVQLETRQDAEVNVRADNKLEIKSGAVKTRVKVGMDADGNIGVGLQLGREKALSIEGGKVKVGVALGLGARNQEGRGKSEVSVESNTSLKILLP